MGIWAFFFLGVGGPVVSEPAVLRAGCDTSAEIRAQLDRGDAVEIRFALSGEMGACYKVAVSSQGRTVEGYLPVRAVAGADQFENGRQGAPSFGASPRIDRVRPPSTGTASSFGASSGIDRANPAGVGTNPLVLASRALNENRPAEALEIAEKLLAGHKNDPEVLMVAGLAAYRSDRVRDAVQYWEQARTVAPASPVEPWLSQAKRELAADQSSQKLFGIQFDFRYDEKDVNSDSARTLLPILDSEFTRVSAQLGCRAEERMTAIVQSREAYQRATGAAEWSGGQYDGRIRVALLEPNPGERTRQVFAHEIVHACLARTGNWPAWLHEGLAQKLSGQAVPPADRALVRQMARDRQLPSLMDMSQTFSHMSERNARVAYATALVAVELFYHHYGTDGVLSLMHDPESLPRIAGEIDGWLRE